MIDGHVHIEKGPYTIEWVNQFIENAIERGISELYILEHSHRFKEFKGIYENIYNYSDYQRNWLNNKLSISIDEYKDLILKLRKRHYPITIKYGLEVCFIEGTEHKVKEVLSNFSWDFITGSVHYIDGFGFDHKAEFWEGKDVDKEYIRYYEIMKNLIKSKLFTAVAHPDSIKCFGYHPSFDLSKTYYEIADLLNEYNMFAEQSGGLYLNYGNNELGMNNKMLDIFKSKGVKLYTASDAHKPEDVGKNIKELEEIIKL